MGSEERRKQRSTAALAATVEWCVPVHVSPQRMRLVPPPLRQLRVEVVAVPDIVEALAAGRRARGRGEAGGSLDSGHGIQHDQVQEQHASACKALSTPSQPHPLTRAG